MVRLCKTRCLTISVTAMLVLSVAIPLGAQDPGESERTTWVYGFVGWSEEYRFTPPQGRRVGVSRIGGGWERLFHRGFGFGVDGGFRPVPDRFDTSFNVHYHILESSGRSSRVSPFATGGLTVAWGVGDGGLGAGEARYNVGGGVNLWIHDRFGPRIEFRHYCSHKAGAALQELRIGGVLSL